ncbi:MAG TPA: hypothetical protein ENJ79_07585 [Gammaproteobacteria bacterium]|nr:hypothetical protein [Gammaproteobacteria bacterium]
MKTTGKSILIGLCVVCVLAAPVLRAGPAPSLEVNLPNATQGPLWPPGELTDAEGNFLVVGLILEEVAPGVVAPVPGAAVVSPETVPPLDANGHEDFRNPFGAPYRVLRRLDLSPGSTDLDLLLHSSSFGPPRGDFGGGPRIPALGQSAYNLNGTGLQCAEIFPAASQRWSYQRPSRPLQLQPVWGFQGDDLFYDVDTGEALPIDEPDLDRRPVGEVTLGQWLAARGRLRIQLTDYDEAAGAYTAAHFHFRFSHLLPHSVYTIWAIRLNNIVPMPELGQPDPVALPNLVVSDGRGRARLHARVDNPFPAPDGPLAGQRIIGFIVNYHDDYQNWGACPARLGPGVESHSMFNTMADGTQDITSFITVAPAGASSP